MGISTCTDGGGDVSDGLTMIKSSTRIKRNCIALAIVVILAATLHLVPGRAWSQADALSPPDSTGYHDLIQSAYAQMTAAFVDNHLERSLIFFADDYRQVDPKGHSLDRDGARKKFQSERNQIRTVQSQCSIVSMASDSDGVHVEMTTHSFGTGAKHVLFFNIPGTFTNDLRVLDLWVSTPDGWRLKSRTMLEDLSVLHSV